MRHFDEDNDAMFEKTKYRRRGMKTTSSAHKLYPRCVKGKQSYPNRKTVEFMLAKMTHYNATEGKVSKQLYIYRCIICPYWHLTHKPPRI